MAIGANKLKVYITLPDLFWGRRGWRMDVSEFVLRTKAKKLGPRLRIDNLARLRSYKIYGLHIFFFNINKHNDVITKQYQS